ncbi:MAG: T9SS type A sorting domain-containing protein [Bacteroidetes bacterium]|nr:T9SS type A sorting domain-containing protein [Bacteroidota bacterium]
MKKIIFKAPNYRGFVVLQMMMKNIFLTITIYVAFINSLSGQNISIAAARALPVGSTVTVTGVCLNGAELGSNIRYINDGTGYIAIFGNLVSTSTTGDEITVTGATVQFQNLLEVGTLTNATINSSGNLLPAAALITPFQLDEMHESWLIKMDNISFANAGAVIGGNATYNFSNSNGETGVMYVRGGSPLIGQTLPLGNVNATGICTQYQSSYQFLLRSMADLVPVGSLYFTQTPYPVNITTSGFELDWETNINSSSFIKYGKTPLLELGVIYGNSNTTSHIVTVTGGLPSEVYYAQCFSVAGTDTAFSDSEIYITASGSSGDIKCYFNRSVDHTRANPPTNLAMQLTSAIDDTLKAYMDRAISTIDITIYNLDNNNTSNIIQGINDAYARGVQVRIIADGSNANNGLPFINSNIPVVLSPQLPLFYYSIMHNKFVVIDANHSDVNKAVVWTGSTNWTGNQLNTDANNVIIIQDKSLAKAYTIEFEEMWGSNTAIPNASNSKFGPDKMDNTPHEFNINGKRVECYFSPSDKVNSEIERTILTANTQLQLAAMVITRYDLAYAIAATVGWGVDANAILDDSANGGGTSFLIMEAVMHNKIVMYDHAALPGILHHKYMIIDQDNASNDALVLTGSHNFSSTANSKNDENTLMVHDASIANQYYQEFVSRFNESGGGLGLNDDNTYHGLQIFPNPTRSEFAIISNDRSLVMVTIYNSKGQQLFQTRGQLQDRINVDFLPQGIYHIEVSGTLQAHGRLVKY